MKSPEVLKTKYMYIYEQKSEGMAAQKVRCLSQDEMTSDEPTDPGSG